MIEVKIPAGVNVALKGRTVTVNGPKGSTTREFKGTVLDLELRDQSVSVSGKGRAIENTVRAHLCNMFKGVTEGFMGKMKIRYAHFPISVEVKGRDILIKNFIGEKKARKARVHRDAKVEVKGTDITISGPDKEAVGQTMANIRRATKIRGHDCRVFQDGIYPVGE